MEFRGTTIVAVKKDGVCAIAGDGQVTSGQQTIMKATAKKVKRIYDDKVVLGFAGSVADAFSLSEKFEAKLQEFSGNLKRAAVELAREWRGDKVLRKLEALMIVADKDDLLVVSGGGEVINPDDAIAAIGSGGNYALAAARALAQNTELTAKEIAQKSIKIASELCVFTNDNIIVETIGE
ncbi:MAG: ATP-dependent protease subunit HslV [Clostridiales bacterium]|nr:ATP-dependent protease subunit HslV [Clostridiales bacterium]